MKSLWKYLFNSTLIIASAGVTQSLIAQEIEQAGIVRISSPRSNLGGSDQVQPVGATQCEGSCGPASCGPMGCNVNGGCNTYGSGGMGMYGGSGMGNGLGGTYDPYGRRMRGSYRNSWNSNGMGDGYGNGATDGYVDGGYGGFGSRRGGLGHGGLGHGWGHGHGYYGSGCPNQNGAAMCDYLRCKFGYFCPTGGGGAGLPWVGHYARVYPLNPHYSDPRDGQAWAAQGYGIPMSVPLAPVVAYTYEYGWGIPSSRVVPVSRPAY